MTNSDTELGTCAKDGCEADATVVVSNGAFNQERCANHDCDDLDHIEVVYRAA